MRVHYDFDLSTNIKKPVVTTGSFDGVHVGHKVIINRLNELAKKINGESVLITFHPHPRKVLYPDVVGKDLKLINTQREKIALLEKTGLDHLIIIKFTTEFSKTTSYDFVTKLLLEKLNAKIIIVGFNHHFGHNRQGDYNYLYHLSPKYHFQVEEIPEQDIQNETVSSTKIRKALSDGNIQRANAYLDHYYIIFGKSGTENMNLKKFGFNNINICIEEDEKLIPPEGIYAIYLEKNKQQYKGMALINNCDLDKQNRQKEISIHPFSHDVKFYQHEFCQIYFHKNIQIVRNLCHHQHLKTILENSKNEIKELIF